MEIVSFKLFFQLESCIDIFCLDVIYKYYVLHYIRMVSMFIKFQTQRNCLIF